MRRRIVTGLVVVAVIAAGMVWAELPAGKAKAIEGLIAQLGDKDFQVREEAQKTLIEMGANVVAMVRKTLAATTDPEVKTRCEKVLGDVRLIEKKVMSLGKVPAGTEGLKASRDGTRIGFVVNDKGAQRICVYGKEGPIHNEVWGLQFSEDGKHSVYVREDGNRHAVVMDGEEGPEWDEVGVVDLCDDGSVMAYWAKKDGKWHVVATRGAGPGFDELGDGPFVSRDGKHIAYSGTMQGGEVAVVDGKAGKRYDETAGLVMSPDGKRVGYSARGEDGWKMIMDEKEEAACEDWGYPSFSPDSKRWAWIIYKGGKRYVLEGGKRGKEYNDVYNVEFSPNSERLAYGADTGQGEDSWRLVVDGVEGPEEPGIGGVWFSPDSRRLAYPGLKRQNNGQFLEWVTCDGMRGKTYMTQEPERLGRGFSKDSQHIFYVMEDDEHYMVVLDGVESPRHRMVALPGGDGDQEGRLRYVVIDGEEAWLVEVEWPEGLDWTNGMRPIEVESKK